ncbi:hypothetical protein EV126DRAFT_413359 [Verticillium dahliae]|nr:hypothetical protein EV126DRAFT_413359 [Verticillium dahliae]
MHWQTNDVEYQLTSTTFTKTSRLPIHDMRLDGTPFTWFRPWYYTSAMIISPNSED